MTCPRCAAALSECAFGVTAIDGCSSCGGLWFDCNELNKLTRDPSVGLMEVERTFEHAAFLSGSGGDMRCPKCSQQLFEFSFPHTPNVKLDSCPACKGIWVDDGELGEIARRISENRPPAVPSNPAEAVQVHARAVTGFLLCMPCPRCGINNPASCSSCWQCGSALKAREVYHICPRCDQPLQERACGAGSEMKVDVCLLCSGVWLDAGEVTALSSLGLEAIDEIQSCVVQRPTSRLVDSTSERTARCPACHHTMEPQVYGARRHVRTDQCVNCSSLWLDAGELIAVYELIHAGEFVSTSRGSDPWADAE